MSRDCIKVAPHTYSFLSRDQLTELKRCIDIAYPQKTTADRKREFVTLACQPTAAARFITHPDFKVTS